MCSGCTPDRTGDDLGHRSGCDTRCGAGPSMLLVSVLRPGASVRRAGVPGGAEVRCGAVLPGGAGHDRRAGGHRDPVSWVVPTSGPARTSSSGVVLRYRVMMLGTAARRSGLSVLPCFGASGRSWCSSFVVLVVPSCAIVVRCCVRPDPAGSGLLCFGQLARRARAFRRFSARRSSSDRPPQTPAS